MVSTLFPMYPKCFLKSFVAPTSFLCLWLFSPAFLVATISPWVLGTPLQQMCCMIIGLIRAAWPKTDLLGCYDSDHKLCWFSPYYCTVPCACEEYFCTCGMPLWLYVCWWQNNINHFPWLLEYGIQLAKKWIICFQIWVRFLVLMNVSSCSFWLQQYPHVYLPQPMQQLISVVVGFLCVDWSQIEFFGCYCSINKSCCFNPSFGTVSCAFQACISTLGLPPIFG